MYVRGMATSRRKAPKRRSARARTNSKPLRRVGVWDARETLRDDANGRRLVSAAHRIGMLSGYRANARPNGSGEFGEEYVAWATAVVAQRNVGGRFRYFREKGYGRSAEEAIDNATYEVSVAVDEFARR